jgi:hypothetical protein
VRGNSALNQFLKGRMLLPGVGFLLGAELLTPVGLLRAPVTMLLSDLVARCFLDGFGGARSSWRSVSGRRLKRLPEVPSAIRPLMTRATRQTKRVRTERDAPARPIVEKFISTDPTVCAALGKKLRLRRLKSEG